jgi:hypothetical protein
VRDFTAAAKFLLDFRDSLIRLSPENLHDIGFKFSEHLFDAPVSRAKTA